MPSSGVMQCRVISLTRPCTQTVPEGLRRHNERGAAHTMPHTIIHHEDDALRPPLQPPTSNLQPPTSTPLRAVSEKYWSGVVARPVGLSHVTAW